MKKQQAKKTMLGTRGTAARRAVTLTELLVVLVIISLLATVAVPIYVSKVEQAKIATAKLECREIAHAEQQCALIHGFFVPFQMLDDVIYDRDIQETDPLTDDLDNEDQDLYLIRPTISMLNQDDSDQLQLNDWDDATPHPMVYNMVTKWAGPFLNPQRVAFGDELQLNIFSDSEEDDAIIQDFPLDPWGNPYRFYSPVGIIGTDATEEAVSFDSPSDSMWSTFSDGKITTDDDRFDRFAVVSYGPNLRTDGQSSDSSFNDTDVDDIIYLFGSHYNESSFRAF